jgi:two-component system response regulator FixJ
MADSPTIFIVDDDEAVLDSLSMLIEGAGMRTEIFGSCREFLAKTALPKFCCLLLDVHMPEMTGLQLQDELAKRGIKLPVIVMTGQADVPLAVRAMKAGAVDFIEKPFTENLMLDSIRRALESSPAAKPVIDPGVKQRLDQLSPREHEVLLQMVAGNPNKVTAHNLGISPRTVEIHRARVMEKMNARSLSELVRMTLSAGIEGPGAG